MTIDDQSPRLRTLADHLKWEAKYAPVLQEACEQRSKTFDDTEAERFALAMDAILCGLQQLRKRGLPLAEAGAVMQHKHHGSLGYTYTDLIRVLSALGWKSGARRRDRESWEPRRG
jgi:hypothetical protein